jgi:hypothetical protein
MVTPYSIAVQMLACTVEDNHSTAHANGHSPVFAGFCRKTGPDAMALISREPDVRQETAGCQRISADRTA